MSAAGDLAIAGVSTGKRTDRSAVLLVTCMALAAFLFIAQHVIDAGYVRRDIADLAAGEAWRNGGWLSQMVLAFASLIPDVDWRQSALSLTAAAAMGLLFGVLYARLRRNGWFVFGAVMVLIALGTHSMVLYSISAASRSIPIYFALAAMIPALRAIEEVGDVQSIIGLGLLMPLLLLAGPSLMPLIPVFALVAALAHPDGRRDPRAFFAMLLVAVLPTLIVGIGIVGFAAQARMDLAGLLLPYVAAYAGAGSGDWIGALTRLVVFAPVMLIPLLALVLPGMAERRHVGSALAVVALPLYLAVGKVLLPWSFADHVPSVALLATFASWLAVVRLPFAMRGAAWVLLLAASVASWVPTPYWSDPEWLAALIGGWGPGNP